VSLIEGLQRSSRRALAFLESGVDQRVNGKKVFDGLDENRNHDVRSRFDHWLSGQHFPKYHHGWPNSETYGDCYVFKWKNAGTHHRLYGFLFNPTPSSDPGFRVCILCTHARKNTEQTNPAELSLVLELKANGAVTDAVKHAFPDEKRRGTGA